MTKMKRATSFLIVFLICAGLSVAAFAATPIRVNSYDDEERMALTNVVHVYEFVRTERHVVQFVQGGDHIFEYRDERVAVVHANAPATLTFLSEMIIYDSGGWPFAFDMAGGYPIHEILLQEGYDIWDFIALEVARFAGGRDIQAEGSREILTPTTGGEYLPRDSNDPVLSPDTTFILEEGIFLVEPAFFSPERLYIVVGDIRDMPEELLSFLNDTPTPEPIPDPIPAPEPTVATGNGVIINGTNLQLDVPPTNINGRLLVPLRAIGEAFGAEFDWDGYTQTATMVRENTTVIMQIGNTEAVVIVDGIETTHVLDAPPMIEEARTLVPLRFIGEIFGAEVRWEAPNAIITTN